MIYNTKGIVLKAVKYGETSLITAIYTEQFGLQSYIVKGVRQSGLKSQGKQNFFQPASVLQMQVYHNKLKNLQFIKEYQWSFLYENLFFDVTRNAIAMYIIELLQRSIKQPEANIQLFRFAEEILKFIDVESNAYISNIPIYFLLQLSGELGFRIQANFSNKNTVLDLQEGCFVSELPATLHYLEGDIAHLASLLNTLTSIKDLSSIRINHENKRKLLIALQNFMAFHIPDFGEMRTLPVLQEVLY